MTTTGQRIRAASAASKVDSGTAGTSSRKKKLDSRTAWSAPAAPNAAPENRLKTFPADASHEPVEGGLDVADGKRFHGRPDISLAQLFGRRHQR
jgi:hypothetical protein